MLQLNLESNFYPNQTSVGSVGSVGS